LHLTRSQMGRMVGIHAVTRGNYLPEAYADASPLVQVRADNLQMYDILTPR
jgi:hypothetical protein